VQVARQHALPVLMPAGGGLARPLVPLALTGGTDSVSEAAIQQLVHENPGCLPIAEIDPLFSDPIPICVELNTPAGPIDNFLITASGLPVIVECKLWRNPEGRREVVGQILDYAKELGRWSSSDLQREVARRIKSEGNSLLELVRAAGHEVDEIAFNDALTLNLRRGRFLLLIVGDGIREGVETIAEYLQAHAGLHFTLGLVELPIYVLPDGSRLAVPRVLAKTQLITRTVVAVPEGSRVTDSGASSLDDSGDGIVDALTQQRVKFLSDVIGGLVLDDPDQPLPKVTPKGYCYLYLPAPASSCWIALTFKPGSAALYVTSNTNTLGEQALQAIAADWDESKEELGGNVELRFVKGRRPIFEETRHFDSGSEQEVIAWLRSRVNDFVNYFRPRVRTHVLDAERSD
jgi:hypothetical protein